MGRFLFVVPPLFGHTNPTVPMAAALVARGHECAWVGHAGVVGRWLPEDGLLFGLEGALAHEEVRAVRERAQAVRGLAALEFLWDEVLIPLADSMVEGVDAAVREYGPDVLVTDQQALAGAICARRRGLSWATIATTSADRRESLGDLPRVLEWSEKRLAELQLDHGLDPVLEVENSPRLVIVTSTGALVGDLSRFPDSYRFVGPCFGERSVDAEFPWDELREGRRVLVSLGTLNAERGGRFFDAVKEALGDLPLQVIAVAPDELGPFPDNFLARPFVPQVELLPRVDAVVCHAGHNTTCEALAHDLPLVVAPIKDDQPVVAQQVVEAGCGLRLSFTRPRPAQLRAAVERVLDEPSFREAAAVVRRSFEAAGGPSRAAELLEELLP